MKSKNTTEYEYALHKYLPVTIDTFKILTKNGFTFLSNFQNIFVIIKIKIIKI